MDKEKIKKITRNPNHIAGIHNYCDRWCQRCEHTARCSVHAIEQVQRAESGSNDLENEAFWKQLHEIFAVTLELVREKAQELGIDLDAIDWEEVQKKPIERPDHELALSARTYADKVRGWFDSSKDLFEAKARELEQRHQMELPGDDPEAEMSALEEITEIIQYYHLFIYVKIRRAAEREPSEIEEVEEVLSYDSNGSAKIALISIDRSMAAWSKMLNYFPDREDEILDFLVRLERLRRGMGKAFPKARSFIRPGLDE